MNIGSNVETYKSFINWQLNPDHQKAFTPPKLRPAVTLSRQTGSGGLEIAGQLAEFLQTRLPVPCHWMVFDKNLAAKVLEEHELPMDMAKFMHEDRISAIRDAVEELLGLHPSSRTLLLLTTETILHLAQLGHVILVGRAANVITQQMKNVFHVRLVAPLDQRVARIMASHQLERKAAVAFIQKQDQGRRRYLKNHFHADIDDNLRYDLVINTGRIPHHEVANLIGEAVVRWAATL